MKKIKTYVLIVSPTFPATHKRKGEKTYFVDKINKRNSAFNNFLDWAKIHTCRKNYPLWEKRIKKIQAGEAILSIRYWLQPGGCYVPGNKQIEVCQLDKDSGIGIQIIEFIGFHAVIDYNVVTDKEHVAKNDGLSLEDFKEWFKNYDLSKPLAIIHFTKFRY